MKQIERQRIIAEAESIGGLFARLIEDAKGFARAEVDYYRLLVTSRVAGLKPAVVLIVVALFLVQASLTTLLIGIGFGIARAFERIGIAGGVVIAALVGLLISGILVRIAVGKIAAAGEPVK